MPSQVKRRFWVKDVPICFYMVVAFSLGFLTGYAILWWQGVKVANDRRLVPTTRADTSKSRVRIFCWILTQPKNHWTKAIHVRNTWAKRCDRFLFMSSGSDPGLPSIGLNVTEDYKHLWGKTKAALAFLHRYHLMDADFFLKADDDTYVVMENLQMLLQGFDPNRPLYMGRRFRPFAGQGYLTGGSGYVLSQEALRRFSEFPEKCPEGELGFEDVNMGICMESLGIHITDSTDELGRERFHGFPLHDLLIGEIFTKDHWIWRYSYHPFKLGPECCSETTVSFHYIAPADMLALEFLIYRLQPRMTCSADDSNA